LFAEAVEHIFKFKTKIKQFLDKLFTDFHTGFNGQLGTGAKVPI